ncbi:MAG: IS701 family transposase [Firmicutes bacterium]|nr:IS701 family transposase [Bacillota bacterium]
MEGTSAQSLQDFITNSPWDHEQLNKQRVELMLENAVASDGALIFDDTDFPKKGNCSVGVARQYSGTLGKVGNCQIAVSCQYTDLKYTWPVNARLYLPESWTSDIRRMKKAKVPEEVSFKTKPQIALELLDQANQLGVKHNIILGDSFYGRNNTFIEGLEARGETYALSVPCNFTVRFEQDIKTFLPPVKSKAKRTGRPRLKPEPTPMPPQYRVDWLIDKIPQVTGRSSAGETAAKESLRNSLLS